MQKDSPLHALQIERIVKVSKDNCSQRWFQMADVLFANTMLLVLPKVVLMFYSLDRPIIKG